MAKHELDADREAGLAGPVPLSRDSEVRPTQDLIATAAVLSAFGFVVGPFVYLRHEMVWDYYTPPAHDHQ